MSLWYLSKLLLVLTVVSCSTIPNVPICVELSISKGYCVNTIDNKEFIIDDNHLYQGLTWFDWRYRMVLLPPNSWAEIKSYIIKECRRTNRCQDFDRLEESIKHVDNNLPSDYNY